MKSDRKTMLDLKLFGQISSVILLHWNLIKKIKKDVIKSKYGCSHVCDKKYQFWRERDNRQALKFKKKYC